MKASVRNQQRVVEPHTLSTKTTWKVLLFRKLSGTQTAGFLWAPNISRKRCINTTKGSIWFARFDEGIDGDVGVNASLIPAEG